MDNVAKSELLIARILNFLLECGISDATMDFGNMGLDESYRTFFRSCVDWLAAEEIIRFRNIHYFDESGDALVIGTTLTARGFAVMGVRLRTSDKDLTVREIAKGSQQRSALSDIGIGAAGNLLAALATQTAAAVALLLR